MFPDGLSMLWEPVDASTQLTARFGFDDVDAATTWIARTLAQRWALDVAGCARIVLSDMNAIAWLTSDRGPLVAKVCARTESFERLAVSATVTRALGHAGIPVASPLPTTAGAARAVVEGPDRPLSVCVQPEIDGDLLDAHDPAQTVAAGATLARLHAAIAPLDVGRLRDARGRVESLGRPGCSDHARERAPRAAARLEQLVPHLPPLGATGSRPQPVHGDYRGANILTRGGTVVAVLDLDDMGIDHRVGDLARAATLVGTRFIRWWPAPAGAGPELLEGYRCAAAAVGAPLVAAEEAWLEALLLVYGLGQIPAGDDTDGWAAAVERWV